MINRFLLPAALSLTAMAAVTWAQPPAAASATPEPDSARPSTSLPPAVRDITLNDAVQMSLIQNPGILTAEQEIKRTKGVVIEVRAQALPQITVGNTFGQESKALILDGAPTTSSNATGGASTSGSSSSGSAVGSSSNAAEDSTLTNPMTQSWDVTVTASQLIYSGGQVAAAIHIAKETEDATIYSLRDVVDTTVANVRSQFYAVLLDRAIIKVQEENITLLESQLKDQQNRFEAGTVPRFNVLQAEVALANSRPQLIQARNDYQVADLNLARTLGINTPDGGAVLPIYPVGVLTTAEKPEPMAQALELARERRPFLKEQREQILIQLNNIKVALAGYQPRLSVDGGYELRNSVYSKSLDDTVNGWFFGVNGTWNVWDSGATYGQVKQAKAQLEEAKANYDDAARQVDVEVQQAWDQVRESQDTIVSQQKTIEEAQEALRLADEELAAGTGTQLNVLSAQVALLQSRTTMVQAQYNYNIAMAQFDRVTAANTDWQELFHDPMVDRQRRQEGLPVR
ncbi:MAG TPA: TolC family protein [Chthoniobacteraceae bacterium]|jgi:outer membrane protein TolC|nr:TolC family protein [Chthoniobacteraceae bacterium]